MVFRLSPRFYCRPSAGPLHTYIENLTQYLSHCTETSASLSREQENSTIHPSTWVQRLEIILEKASSLLHIQPSNNSYWFYFLSIPGGWTYYLLLHSCDTALLLALFSLLSYPTSFYTGLPAPFPLPSTLKTSSHLFTKQTQASYCFLYLKPFNGSHYPKGVKAKFQSPLPEPFILLYPSAPKHPTLTPWTPAITYHLHSAYGAMLWFSLFLLPGKLSHCPWAFITWFHLNV